MTDAARPTLSDITARIEQSLTARGVGAETAARLAQQQAPAALERAQAQHDYRAVQQAEQERLVGQGVDPAEAEARGHRAATQQFGNVDPIGSARADAARVNALDPDRFKGLEHTIPESLKNDPAAMESLRQTRLAEEQKLYQEFSNLHPINRPGLAHVEALNRHGVQLPMMEGSPLPKNLVTEHAVTQEIPVTSRPEPVSNVDPARAASVEDPMRNYGTGADSPQVINQAQRPAAAVDDVRTATSAAGEGPLRTVGPQQSTLPPQQGAPASPAAAERVAGAPDRPVSFNDPEQYRAYREQLNADRAAADATRTHQFPDGTTATGAPDEHGKLQWFDNDTGEPLKAGDDGKPVKAGAPEAPQAARPPAADPAPSAARPQAPAADAAPRPAAPSPAPASPHGGQPLSAGQPDAPRVSPVQPASPAAPSAATGDAAARGAAPVSADGSPSTHVSGANGATVGADGPNPTATPAPDAGNPAATAASTNNPAPTTGNTTAPDQATTSTDGGKQTVSDPTTDPANGTRTADAPDTKAADAPASTQPTTQPADAPDAKAADATPRAGDAPAQTAPQTGDAQAQTAPQTGDAPTKTGDAPAQATAGDAPGKTGDAPATHTSGDTGGAKAGDAAAKPTGTAPAGTAPAAQTGTGSAPDAKAGDAPDAKTSGAPDAKTSGAPDAKATSKTPVKDISQITPNDKASTIGKSFGKAYLEAAKNPIKGIPAIMKAEYKAGAALGDKLAGKIAGEGLLKGAAKIGLKTAGRAIPGLGTAIGLYSAYNSFKNGDVVGGALDLVSAIPGPIGWIGLAGSMVWKEFFGKTKIGMWDAPDGSSTHILPGSAKDVGGVTDLDQMLRQAQQAVFSFQDGPQGTVWNENHPNALSLETEAIVKDANAWLGGVADLFAEIDKAMASAGEQYFTEYQARLKPHLDAMAKLKTDAKALTDELANSSKGATTAYNAVLEANRAAREQLSNDSKLSDQGPAQTLKSQLQNAVSVVGSADQKIAAIFANEPPAVLTANVKTNTGTREDPSKKTDPKATAPANTTAPTNTAPTNTSPQKTEPTKTETPKKDDDLSKLLNSLGQQKPTSTPTSNPLGTGGGSGLGGGSPLNSGGGGSPLSSGKSSKLDDGEGKKLDDGKKKGEDKKTERKLEDPSKDKKEEKKPTPLSASQTDNKVSAVPGKEEAKPGTPAPAAAAAVPAGAAKPAPPGAQPEASKEVDVKGNKTTFPDAKTAKMAQLLANADPAHPLSLTDAAAQAGLTPPVPGQDPGSQVAPAQAKPGDLLVSGDKKFMLLGDGKFYDLQEYKVVSADQLPQDAGSRGGYFHLNDPSPTGAPGTQPVSGQTAGVDQQVPGGTPPPAAPANASPAAPGAPGAPGAHPSAPGTDPGAGGQGSNSSGQGSPSGAPASPGSGGIPSTGTPGAPKPGTGGGPANAASTATGNGVPQPSSSTTALDPSAVR